MNGTKAKLFGFLIFLTLVSSGYMVYAGLQVKSAKGELSKMMKCHSEMKDLSLKISYNRAKITAQRKHVGGNPIELNAKPIEKSCENNGVQLSGLNPIKDLDRGDYIEKGYLVKLASVDKVRLGRLLSDLESSIPGAKIKTQRMSQLSQDPKNMSVSFVIVKSYPKEFDLSEIQ